jgi:hypothetical protein
MRSSILTLPILSRWIGRVAALGAALAVMTATQAKVLDNFDDNVKTDWSDFTFVPGVGLPVESNGQFRFEIPPAGQSLFTAGQKKSETFELKEGRTVEFKADVIQTGGKDSFAILAFIPTDNSPGTLAGYGIAKSTTDILITKGINKYFVAESWPADGKNENITLSLRLTVRNGNVEINARILDKDQANKVIYDKTVIDTPAADVLASGKDDPATPYIKSGYYTLYCYEDFSAAAPENPYKVYFDNAETFVTDTSVLDNFDDNVKTDWSDFTFVPGVGLPVESNGQFRFEIPPAGQSLFTAGQKKSRTFDLKEGERVEFRADVIQTGGKDSFAILAFIPTDNSPGTLAGYGLAKSTTDILITKGINKYFVAESWPSDGKNENITLSLTLTVRNGNVEINARILDKDQANRVIYDKTVIDTPAADVLASGKDDPAAPYIKSGYYTLYCYEDFSAAAPENPYKVYFDNAVVSAPPQAANVAPIITITSPDEAANFLPATTQISLKVSDDKAIADDGIAVLLNGTRYTKTNGLALSAAGSTRTATLGGLKADQDYAAIVIATDSDGASSTNSVHFDTFTGAAIVVEIEDYNYGGGQFFDNPAVSVEGAGGANSFGQLAGVADVDFSDTRTGPNGNDTLYRSEDPIRMQHSLDTTRAKYTAAGGKNAGVFDYDVSDFAIGEWENYTRTIPAGSYEVYLREAVSNLETGDCVLEQVTSDRTQPNQTVKLLGTFLGKKTGFQYRNFPLTDGAGISKTVLRLNGVTTLRLRHLTADSRDGARFLNYMVLLPVADTGIQRAAVTSITPAPGSSVQTVTPEIDVVIQNKDTTVVTSSVNLTVNGTAVTPKVTSAADGATVQYALATLPASGANNTATLIYKDNLGVSLTNTWSFIITYPGLDPAWRVAGTGKDRGLKVRVVQATEVGENSLDRAEQQLVAGSTIAKLSDTTVTATSINYSQNAIDGGTDGFFDGDAVIPGQTAENGSDNFAMEVTGYLDLPAGIIRFGVNCDDGYKLTINANPTPTTTPIMFHNGGPASETADIVVPQAGLYPYRFVWYERTGAAHVEWFTVNPDTGVRTLVNTTGSVASYLSITAPALSVESADSVSGAYAAEAGAQLNSTAKTITLTRSAASRFYRIKNDTLVHIKGLQLTATTVVLSYE